MIGYRKQSQTVFVDLGLITSPSNDLNSASITLESRDVIVTSASFMGMAKFRGSAYLFEKLKTSLLFESYVRNLDRKDS